MKEIFKLILLLVILSGCIENDEEVILNNNVARKFVRHFFR